MSNLPATNDEFKKIEVLVLQGDLSKLNPEEKVAFYNRVCESVGLNPFTRPLEYIKLQGKETLYARKDATDQLRKINNISLKISSTSTEGDLYVATAQAKTKDGREDEDIGIVNVKGLSGEALANAKMKAITKAKRRVTLAICGLGFLDETEVADARDVSSQAVTKAKELTETVQATEKTPDFEASTYFEAEAVPQELGVGDTIFNVGKKNKGKKLRQIPLKELAEFVDWARGQGELTEEAQDCAERVQQFLEEASGVSGERNLP